MKLPYLMSLRQAVILAIAAIVVAIFLKLFAPMAIAILLCVGFLSATYAGLLKWAPEYVKAP